MSFGTKEYQHRFHTNANHKKSSLNSNYQNNIFPLLTNQSLRPIQNSPNIMNEVKGSSPKRKNEGNHLIPYANYLQYQKYQDAETIEKFRKEGEAYRRRLLNGSQAHRYSLSRNEQSPHSKKNHQIQMNKGQNLQFKDFNFDNPQQLGSNHVSQMKSCFDKYQLEKDNIISRLQINDSIKKRKIKEYKQKYSKIKTKLKEEAVQKKKQQIRTLHRKEQKVLQQETKKLDEIQVMLSNISTGLQRNSDLINESMKLSSQVTMKDQSTDRINIIKNPQKPINAKNIIQEEEQVLSQDEEEVKLPKIIPKIIYTKKKLQAQYLQLQKLKKYIETTDFRIKRLKTQ